jgi:hypothetical protein
VANQIVIDFSADISKLLPAIEALEQLGQIDKKSAEIFKATNAEYQKRNQEVNKLSAAYTNLSEEVASGALKEHKNELNKQTEAIVKQVEQTENLTKKLRAMIRELAAMKAAGKDNTDEFRRMSREAGELQDTIGDAREQVRALASDTKKLDAVAQAFRGIAAGMSIAAGASALFGEENEDLQKSLLKVQAAMAVLNGVQELATLATGQNYLKTLLLDGAQKAVAVSARVMGVSVQTATAAMTLGISLVVAGIVYLVDYLTTADEKVDELTDKSIETQKKNLSVQQRITDLRISLIKDDKKRELAELDRAYKLEQAQLKADIKNKIISWEQYSELLTLISQKKLQDEEKIEERYRVKKIDKRKIEKKEIEKLVREQVKYEVELKTEGFQKISDNYSSFNAAQLKAAEDFNMSQSELMDEFYKSGIEDFEQFIAAKKAIRDKDAEDQKNLEQAIKQFAFNSLSEISNAAFQISENRMKAQLESELRFLDSQRDAILGSETLTEKQREAIQMEYEQKKRTAQIQAWKSQQEAAIAQGVINGALAVGNALATVKPFPAALVAAATAAISTAAQVAVIRSQPVPQFAEGTEFLEGAGTGKSDSIHAMLSRGERVVPARTNADYFDGLSVIQNRLVAPELVNTLLTNLAENGGMLDVIAVNEGKQSKRGDAIDYEKLGEIFRRSKSEVNINADINGFTVSIQKGLNKATYHNRKLRIK